MPWRWQNSAVCRCSSGTQGWYSIWFASTGAPPRASSSEIWRSPKLLTPRCRICLRIANPQEPPFRLCPLQRQPRLLPALLRILAGPAVRRHGRPVQQNQINVLQAKLLQRPCHPVCGSLEAEVWRIDLGGQKDVRPGNSCSDGLPNALPNLRMVLVHRGIVDVPTAHEQVVQYGLPSCVAIGTRSAAHPDASDRHGTAPEQLQARHRRRCNKQLGDIV
mmetsp:Transcript_87125/g.281340  ORF Transcript_87125/g.281340 Transcript_87125/m.281340 type:complete len:219 (-) Transcript_87125:332-988(-)